jgi:hypothetical protein
MKRKYHLFSKSIIGNRHINYDEPCQDAALSIEKNDVHVAIVCDGCGSKEHSEEGAILLCARLSDKLTNEFDALVVLDELALKRNINDFVNNSVKQYAQIRSSKVTDLLSTYVFSAVKNNQWIICRCGDGGIITFDDQGNTEIFLENKKGYANETTYFNSPNCLNEMHASIIDSTNITGTFIFSDGVQESIIDGSNINELVDWAIKRNTLTNREKVNSALDRLLTVLRDNTDDDCSFGVTSLVNKQPKNNEQNEHIDGQSIDQSEINKTNEQIHEDSNGVDVDKTQSS